MNALKFSIGHSWARAGRSAAAMILLIMFGGCVALGVPSQRFNDPDDRGGLLGNFRPAPQVDRTIDAAFPNQASNHADALIAAGATLSPATDACCDVPYPLDIDPTTGQPRKDPPPPPEIPWPKYHPVPTRPVFGGPGFSGPGFSGPGFGGPGFDGPGFGE